MGAEKIKELDILIKQAGQLSNLIDNALSQKYTDCYNDKFTAYTLWKIRCKPLFFEGETKDSYHLAYPEYYTVFQQSDGVGDPSDLVFNDLPVGELDVDGSLLSLKPPVDGSNADDLFYTDVKLIDKGLRTTRKDKTGRLVVDEEYVRQMNATKVGLEKRMNALLNLLQYLKNKKLDMKVVLTINKKNKTISRDSFTCVFRREKNKRFEYILTLLNSGKTDGQKLKGGITMQALSGELGKINLRLKNDLRLTEDVIENKKNSGYKINENFYSLNIV